MLDNLEGHYGFTGTQRGMTVSQKIALREFIRGCTGSLHHGDCVGADATAHDLAEDCGLKIIIHPPKNSSKRAWKKAPADCMREEKDYLDRNRDIVNDSFALLACPGETVEQLRSGTWSTVRYARKIGRQVTVIFPDGSVC